MTDPYRGVLDALAGAGWKVRERSVEQALPWSQLWPAELRERYPNMPSALTGFLGRLDECVNADDTAWFLTAADYAGTSGSPWAWNAWELLELESCAESDDAEAAAEVRQFWNDYLPFYMDVGGDYAYFAVRVTGPKSVTGEWLPPGARPLPEPRLGAVVHAEEEFRAVAEVAPSFSEFLDQLAAAMRDPPQRRKGPLAGMI